MDIIIIYFVESTVCILVFIGLYRALFQKLTFFEWKRAYLLFILLASFLMPVFAIEIEKGPNTDILLYSNQIIESFEGHIETIGQSSNSTITIGNSVIQNLIKILVIVLAIIYLCIVGWKLLRLFQNIQKATAMPADAIKCSYHGISSISSNSITRPYSFFKTIYLPKTLALNRDEISLIIKHERIHVLQLHSIDLIFAAFVKAIFWFNPIYSFIRNEIELLHEFIADAAVNDNRNCVKQYAQILLRLTTGIHNNSLTNNFSKIQIKERIIMLNQNTSNQIHKVKFFNASACTGLIISVFFNGSGGSIAKRHLV